MIEHAREVQQNLHEVTFENWISNRNLQIVVSHLLMIVGEAASNVSEDLKIAHPEVPWLNITGLRHRIIHGYDKVDRDKIWKAATEDVPVLIASLEQILGR